MRIGEIIETRSSGFVAENFELNRPPALGSLVVVNVEIDAAQSSLVQTSAGVGLYAVVTYGQTVGLDPGRPAMRRGTETVHDAAIYKEHPELKHVLRTEFGAALVGLQEDDVIRQQLPSQPPPLHYSVHTTTSEQLQRFTEQLLYLRLLLIPHGEVPPAQVLAANIREVYRQRGDDRLWLDAAAQQIAILLRDDHQTLLTVLYGIDPDRAVRSTSEARVSFPSGRFERREA
jgi:hypothetical protein